MKTWITGVISLNLIQDVSRAIHVHKQREQSCVRFIHLEFASFITKTDNIKCSFYHQMENSTKLGEDLFLQKRSFCDRRTFESKTPLKERILSEVETRENGMNRILRTQDAYKLHFIFQKEIWRQLKVNVPSTVTHFFFCKLRIHGINVTEGLWSRCLLLYITLILFTMDPKINPFFCFVFFSLLKRHVVCIT